MPFKKKKKKKDIFLETRNNQLSTYCSVPMLIYKELPQSIKLTETSLLKTHRCITDQCHLGHTCLNSKYVMINLYSSLSKSVCCFLSMPAEGECLIPFVVMECSCSTEDTVLMNTMEVRVF